MKRFNFFLILSSFLYTANLLHADLGARSSWQTMAERTEELLQESEIEIDNRLIQTYQSYAGIWTRAGSNSSVKKTCKEAMCDEELFRRVNELSTTQKTLKRDTLYFVPFTTEYVEKLRKDGIYRQKVTVKKGQYIWPVMGIRITSRVGSRWGRTHGGIDVAAARGSIVVAATDGTVMLVGDQGPYGHCVFVENNDGTYAWYAHLTDSYVKPGDKITRGQIVASSGNTGRSTGPHLHFEMRTQQGIILDPEHFFVLPFDEHLRQSQEFETDTASHGALTRFKQAVN